MSAKESTKSRSRTAPAQPNAIQLLKDDHAEVKQLFDRFEKLADDTSSAEREEIVREACAKLVHATVEEEIFYPAARETPDVADLWPWKATTRCSMPTSPCYRNTSNITPRKRKESYFPRLRNPTWISLRQVQRCSLASKNSRGSSRPPKELHLRANTYRRRRSPAPDSDEAPFNGGMT